MSRFQIIYSFVIGNQSVLSLFPRGVLDEILNLIESVSEGFPSYTLLETFIVKGMRNCIRSLDAIV